MENIINPDHYKSNSLDLNFDLIMKYNLNFNEGNFLKYVFRAGNKDNEIQDLLKAIEYIKFEDFRITTDLNQCEKKEKYTHNFDLKGFKKHFFDLFCEYTYNTWQQKNMLLGSLEEIIKNRLEELQNESKAN